jgi:hypothetical protein
LFVSLLTESETVTVSVMDLGIPLILVTESDTAMVSANDLVRLLSLAAVEEIVTV